MLHWQTIFAVLREHDIPVSDRDMPRPVAGGDTSATWRINSAESPVFLKTGPASSYAMFLAEAEGLRELAAAGAIRVPHVLGCVSSGSESLLALEWLELEPALPAAETLLGEQLAKQHRVCAKEFGWRQDNMIGANPQMNSRDDDWINFYAEQRIAVQLDLARSNGFVGQLQENGRRLLQNIAGFFSNYWPEPSLLHGDLWGGNWAVSAGEPVVFDPAVYHGDRETDLAMTRLFGGFGAGFYAAYADAWPLANGHEERVELYQLYHVLNHLNLFGDSYLARAESMLRRLI